MPFSLFARLVVLRANPQDLPADVRVLGVALAAHVIADVLALLDTVAIAPALFAAVLDTVLLAALAHTALLLRGFGARAVQTIAALAGTGALLSLLHGLLSKVLSFDSPLVLGLPFLAWFLVVYAHILREALSVSRAAGFGASLLYIILSLGVAGIVLPPPPEAP